MALKLYRLNDGRRAWLVPEDESKNNALDAFKGYDPEWRLSGKDAWVIVSNVTTVDDALVHCALRLGFPYVTLSDETITLKDEDEIDLRVKELCGSFYYLLVEHDFVRTVRKWIDEELERPSLAFASLSRDRTIRECVIDVLNHVVVSRCRDEALIKRVYEHIGEIDV